jgi:hypothetical protein
MRSTCVAHERAVFCCVTLYGQSHAVSMWQLGRAGVSFVGSGA